MDHNQLPVSSGDTARINRNQNPPVILVIDDEAMILDMLHDVLDSEGYKVLVAQDGQAGLGRTLDAQPDLIMTDVMMPVMDGHELCRRLRADPRTATTAMIAMSAAYRSQAGDAFDAVIAKPFGRVPLLALIQSQVGRAS